MLHFCYSPAMPLRFWNIARCGAEGAGAELACSWASWLAVVFINSMAAWRTLNCRTTAISRGRGIQSIHYMLYIPSGIFTRCLQHVRTQCVKSYKTLDSTRVTQSHLTIPQIQTLQKWVLIEKPLKLITLKQAKLNCTESFHLIIFKERLQSLFFQISSTQFLTTGQAPKGNY